MSSFDANRKMAFQRRDKIIYNGIDTTPDSLLEGLTHLKEQLDSLYWEISHDSEVERTDEERRIWARNKIGLGFLPLVERLLEKAKNNS